jgi:preprotein translocase subunit SecA
MRNALRPARGEADAAGAGAFEERMRALTDAELRELTGALRSAAAGGQGLEAVLPEALAAAREAGARALGERATPEQVRGALALCRGRLAELRTGEGKTLMIALAAYAWSLAGEGVHVLTANGYLARRDAEWMQPVFEALGVSSALVAGVDRDARRAAYAADVTYLTAAEAGYDLLRDNLRTSAADRVQRPLRRAIVDEADAVLIDDGLHNVNISVANHDEKTVELYRKTAAVVRRLDAATDWTVDAQRLMVTLTERGVFRVEDLLGTSDFYRDAEPELQRALDDTLRAWFAYERDREYVVLDGVVSSLDRLTGRLDHVVRLPAGLNTALEIKERIAVTPQPTTIAMLSQRGLVRRYPRLAATTGTAMEERLYREAYGLEVERIPTHRPVRRVDRSPVVHRDDEQRAAAVLERVAAQRAAGRPVLLVTASIAQTDDISARLTRRGIPHTVLTAKNHEQEAEVIAHAGRTGAVTVVTRMAGRGVDIRLGGDDVREHAAIVRAGGLYVLGFDLYENRRLEQHMRSRAGRRGDPGESLVLLSLQDPSTRTRFSPTARRILEATAGKQGFDTGRMLGRRLTDSLDGANRRWELHTLSRFETEAVLDDQAAQIHRLREALFAGDGVDRLFREHMHAFGAARVAGRAPGRAGLEALHADLAEHYPIGVSVERLAAAADEDGLDALIRADLDRAHAARTRELSAPVMAEVERRVMLGVIDRAWRRHLPALDDVFHETTLHGLTGVDWQLRYRREAGRLFRALLARIDADGVGFVFHLDIGAGPAAGPEVLG